MSTLWRRIDDQFMVSAKLIFFTMSMVIYGFYVFRGPFISDYLGIKMTHYGIISATMAAISFPCMTLWNTFADYLGRHKIILILITLSAVGSFECLMIRFPHSESVQLIFALAILALYSFFTSGMTPLLDYEALKLLSSRPGFTKEMYGRQRMWGTMAYAVSTMVSAFLMEKLGQQVLFFIMPTFAAIFAVTLLFTGPSDEPKSLQQIRNRLAGEVQGVGEEDGCGGKSESCHLLHIIGSGLSTSQHDHYKTGSRNASSVDLAEPKKRTLESETGTTGVGVQVLDDKLNTSTSNLVTVSPVREQRVSPWRTLLTNGNFLFFLFAVFMNGMARTVMTIFLSMYWKKVLLLDSRQIAVATIFGIAIEVIIFYFYRFFAPLGNYWMLVIAQAAMVARCWTYYQLPAGDGNKYWQVWMIELLKGVAFGFTHTAGVRIAAESAPAGLEATAQALYTSMYAQLPAVIAAALGGSVYEVYGPSMLFLITSIISTVALGLFLIKYSIDGKIRLWPKKSAESTPINNTPLPPSTTITGNNNTSNPRTVTATA